MFDPNDVNNVKADPATFNSNEFVGSLNLTSAQLKTLIDAFETFTDTASYNVNGTALEIEKLQSQFNELHNICTNVCPKCINLATIQTQIATKNVQKKKELDQHRMLDVIKHKLEQKIKNAKDAELKAQTQQRARQMIEDLTQKFNMALGSNLQESEQIYNEIYDLMKLHIVKYPDDVDKYQEKITNLYNSLIYRIQQQEAKAQNPTAAQGGARKKHKSKKSKKSKKSNRVK